MTTDDLLARGIAHFGGVSALARALGVSQPSVSIWKRKGRLPQARLNQLAALLSPPAAAKAAPPELDPIGTPVSPAGPAGDGGLPPDVSSTAGGLSSDGVPRCEEG